MAAGRLRVAAALLRVAFRLLAGSFPLASGVFLATRWRTPPLFHFLDWFSSFSAVSSQSASSQSATSQNTPDMLADAAACARTGPARSPTCCGGRCWRGLHPRRPASQAETSAGTGPDTDAGHGPGARPGARPALPAENCLAREFGVSRNTVRQALDLLRAEGLVERVPGSAPWSWPGSTRTAWTG